MNDTEFVSEEDLARPPKMALWDRSFDERRQLLAEQAERMKEHYEQTDDERAEWQAGDFDDRCTERLVHL